MRVCVQAGVRACAYGCNAYLLEYLCAHAESTMRIPMGQWRARVLALVVALQPRLQMIPHDP